jgi:hypothetical protein
MCSEHDHAIHEVTGAEDALAELRRRVDALEVQLAAEREVSAAVAEGNRNVPAIVAALRKRADALTAPRAESFARHQGVFEHPADVDRRMWLGNELYTLADQIEQDLTTERKNQS